MHIFSIKSFDEIIFLVAGVVLKLFNTYTAIICSTGAWVFFSVDLMINILYCNLLLNLYK